MKGTRNSGRTVMMILFGVASIGQAATFSLSGPGQTGNTITVAPGANFTVTAAVNASEVGNTFEIFLGYDKSSAVQPGLTGTPTLNKLTLVSSLTQVANSINTTRFDVWQSAKAATAREANNLALGGRPYGLKIVGAGHGNTAGGLLTLCSVTFRNNMVAGDNASIVISDNGTGASYTSAWKSGTTSHRGGYVLTVASGTSRLPGDANGDHKVDVSDLGILAANYGMTANATWEKGDFNGDGKVDVSDLGILAANYGTGTGANLDFNKDAAAFGLVVAGDEAKAQDDQTSVTSTLGCGSAGLPLMAGVLFLAVFGLTFAGRKTVGNGIVIVVMVLGGLLGGGISRAYGDQVVWEESFTGTTGSDITSLGWTFVSGAATMQVSDQTIDQGQSGKAILSGSMSVLYYKKAVNYTVGSTYANEDVEIKWALSKNGQDVPAELCLYIDSSDGTTNLLDWEYDDVYRRMLAEQMNQVDPTRDSYTTGLGIFTDCEMKMVALHGQNPTFWYNTAIGSTTWTQIPLQYAGWSGEPLSNISQIRLWIRGAYDNYPLYVDSIKITVSGQPLPPPGQVVWQESFTGTTGSDISSLDWMFLGGAATMQVSDQTIDQGQSGKSILSGSMSSLYYSKPVNYTVGSTYGANEEVEIKWTLSKNGQDVLAEFALYIDSINGNWNLLDWQFNYSIGHRMLAIQMSASGAEQDYYTGVGGLTACEMKMVALYGQTPTYWYNTAIGSNTWYQIPLQYGGLGGPLLDISQFRLWIRGEYDTYPLYVDSIKVTVYNVNTCATPVFSPDGGAWAAPIGVTISCATPGATIHYTLDGSDPTLASPTYGGAITISGNTTVKAQAWADGYEPSAIATAQYSFPAAVFNRPNPIRSGTATIDGNLADWADATWVPLDQDYFGSFGPNIQEASYAAKWDPSGTTLYVAAKVLDTASPYLSDYFAGWASQDDVEIYIHTNGSYPGNSTNYQSDQGAAQQYIVGIATDNVSVWSVIVNTSPLGGQAIPAAANFQAAGRFDGQWLYYEMAITPFKVFSLGGTNMVASPVHANQIIGLDVIASNMYRMKSENLMKGKSTDYTKFGLHKLVIVGDVNGDGVVNAADLAIVLAAMDSTPPSDSSADLDGDGEVTSTDLSIMLANMQ